MGPNNNLRDPSCITRRNSAPHIHQLQLHSTILRIRLHLQPIRHINPRSLHAIQVRCTGPASRFQFRDSIPAHSPSRRSILLQLQTHMPCLDQPHRSSQRHSPRHQHRLPISNPKRLTPRHPVTKLRRQLIQSTSASHSSSGSSISSVNRAAPYRSIRSRSNPTCSTAAKTPPHAHAPQTA